jgi:hypothetical protein
LAAHLLRDAFTDACDLAIVISADTDLVEPIRIVTEELKRPVGLFSPDGQPSKHLANVITFCRHINPSLLSSSQLPDPVVGRNGKTVENRRHGEAYTARAIEGFALDGS